MFDVPTAWISFVDARREWMKARHGFDRRELPLPVSFGAEVVTSNELLVVEDAADEPQFRANPLVTHAPGVRFYAGAPLHLDDGLCIGTVAVMDTKPWSPSQAQQEQLQNIAALVIDLLEAQSRPTKDEHLIDALLSSSSANAVILDEDGMILRTNKNWQSFAQANGLDDLTSVGKGTSYLDALAPSADTTDENTTQRARDGLKRILRGEQDTFELVYPCHSPTEKRWFQMRVRRLDHSWARAIVSHRDVTDRRWQNRQRRILETAVEHAQEAIVITKAGPLDNSGPPITYVNPAFTDMTGYDGSEVMDESPSILQGPETETWVLREMRHQLRRGKSFEGEAINYRKDGTPFINHWSVAPVRDQDGKISHWVSFQRDVTEERHMEKRLLEAQERERQRIAQEMHHEMGGLLASLQMAVDDTQARIPDAASPPESLTQIERIANELSSVVRTLTERLHSRVIDDYGLSDAVSRMATDFHDQYGLSVDVYNEIPDNQRLPPLVEKISYRGIREALKNVAEHAETDDAQLLLNVDSQTLRLHVIDDGAGFDPSSELANDQYGLLAIKKRVDRMNGHLDVSSAPGEGSRISMTLPLTFGPTT